MNFKLALQPYKAIMALKGVNGALKQLEDVGILRRLNERKWGRSWECDELLDLVEDFEESVTTGIGAGT